MVPDPHCEDYVSAIDVPIVCGLFKNAAPMTVAVGALVICSPNTMLEPEIPMVIRAPASGLHASVRPHRQGERLRGVVNGLVVSAHLRPEEITVRLGFIEDPEPADAVGDAGFRIPDRVDHHPPIQRRGDRRPWP